MSITLTTKTPTRNYADSDASLPRLGTIDLYPSALPSQEQDLVHGDVKRDIHGNVLYNLFGNRINQIFQDFTEFIYGNFEQYVSQKSTETKVGQHLHTNIGPRIDSFVGPVDRSFQASVTEHHPETWFQHFANKMHYEAFALKTGLLKVDLFGLAIAANLVGKLSMDANKLDLTGILFKANPLYAMEIATIKQKIHTAVTKFIVTGMLIGMLELGTPFKPNALPRPSIITPFD